MTKSRNNSLVFFFSLEKPRLFVLLIFLMFPQFYFYSQEMPFLKVSNDQHFLETESGEPFFWMGDTAWELVHRLDKEEVLIYLKDRREKGFSVIQTVILAEQEGLNVPNAYGEKPLLKNDPGHLNEKYFEHLDFVLNEAEKSGLYVGLLPAWGDKFNKKWGVAPEILTPENAEVYGELLGKRYKRYPNIIWILGGDRIPETTEHYKIIQSLARGIKKTDNNHLLSYHPSGAEIASDYFEEDWLDIDMFQSEHSSLAKKYKYVLKEANKQTVRPVVNGEARYEDIPDRFWKDDYFGRLNEADVRISAYWSMLAGAAGYTYGSNDVWQMYSNERTAIIDAQIGWKKALQLPGAEQMKFMKEFFTSLEWQKMSYAPGLILSENPEDTAYIIAAKASEFALFYTPEGRSFKANLQQVNFQKIKAYWFNPRTGVLEKIQKSKILKSDIFEPPSSGKGRDCLLALLPKANTFNLNKIP